MPAGVLSRASCLRHWVLEPGLPEGLGMSQVGTQTLQLPMAPNCISHGYLQIAAHLGVRPCQGWRLARPAPF